MTANALRAGTASGSKASVAGLGGSSSEIITKRSVSVACSLALMIAAARSISLPLSGSSGWAAAA